MISRNLFLLCFLLGISPVLFAQSSLLSNSSLDRLTATDRLMIGFKAETTLQRRAELVSSWQRFHRIGAATPQVQEGVYLLTARSGGSWAASDFPLLQREMYAFPEVEFVYPVLIDTNQDWFGMQNRVWVSLESADYLQELAKFSRDHGIEYAGHNELAQGWHLLKTDKNSDLNPLELSFTLSEMEWVRSAEVDYLFSPIVCTNDPQYSKQWAIKNTGQNGGVVGADMNVEAAWNFTTGDPATVIAILDSGTDTNHVDLIDNLLPGFDGIGSGQKGYPNTTMSEDGHGTACSGIVAAKANNNIGTAGVCYDCSIMPVRVFYYVNDSVLGILPWSTPTWMMDGINYARLNGADVMSNSWGVPDGLLFLFPGGTTMVEAAMDSAFTLGRGGKGIPMFFSSGNDGGRPIWPSRVRGAIAVNATSMCDERKSANSCDGENWAGNWADSLDIAAPGVNIATADMTDTLGYTATDWVSDFNGTSAACPNAAAVMGLILSADPSLSIKTARKYLESSCDKTGGYNYFKTLENGSWCHELGYGRVNAGNALQAVSRDKSLRELGLSMTLFPNPVRDHLTLEMDLQEAAQLDFSLVSLNGKTVWSERRAVLGAGQHQLQFSLPEEGLGQGMYIFKVKGPMGIVGRKLMVLD